MVTAIDSKTFGKFKEKVGEAGLLDKVPIRGSIEMLAVFVSLAIVFIAVSHWDFFTPHNHLAAFGLGLFMVVIFTRAVFVSHDILHLQYFKGKSLSFKLSYPFSALILSNSSSWWDHKHNINHHTWCNVLEKDEDIWALDGAFTPNNKGNSPFIKKYKHIIFWGAMFFMYAAFIVQSYNYVIKRKLWGELALMLMHIPLIWGTIFYFLPLTDALIVLLTLNFVLSPWLAFGFITNHLGCEVFDYAEGKNFSWMELQMRTSRSLKGGVFVHWFYGGLNTQIEHHLFPKAPRFNLLKIQNMTREFAKKHNIKYFETTPIEAYIQINDAIKEY
ncbi:MAG: acyl-CoA desaturase [Sulfurimonas sp.]|nr:acyl-CoA desaturase [Sulfurimonas sp.]